ncbi:MAG: hypothetical protein Q9167_000416 [Letrouitia subvulpina]
MVVDTSAEPAFDSNDRFFTPESALTILSSLVAVTLTEVRWYPYGPIKEVHLAHYSVKEYLVSARAREGPAACFAISRTTAQEQIVQSCLHYLQCCEQEIVNIKNEFDLHTQCPLLLYAASTWSIHAKTCGQNMSEDTMKMIVNMLEIPDLWVHYCEPEDWKSLRKFTYRYTEWNFWKSPSPLYYAACLGLAEIVKYLLEQDSEVNEENGRYGNALQAASFKKHVSVVIILIQNGADVNKRGGFFGSALNVACFSGSPEIVEQLIGAGALAESQGNLGSPLDTLSGSPDPSPDIVKQLLHLGALPIAKKGSSAWVIRWAATSGYADVIQLIIEKMPISGKTLFLWTIGISSKGNHQSYQREASAPYEAVYQRHEAVVKLFVEKWSNLNETDVEGRTSLYWACFLGCSGIVKMLLDHGADLHCAGPNEWVARYWAALFDDQETLRLLNHVCSPSTCDKCAFAEGRAKVENKTIFASQLSQRERSGNMSEQSGSQVSRGSLSQSTRISHEK